MTVDIMQRPRRMSTHYRELNDTEPLAYIECTIEGSGGEIEHVRCVRGHRRGVIKRAEISKIRRII